MKRIIAPLAATLVATAFAQGSRGFEEILFPKLKD